MSAEAEIIEPQAQAQGASEVGDKKSSNLVKILLILVVVLLCVACVGGTLFFTGFFNKKVSAENSTDVPLENLVFVPIPEMLVNLSYQAGKKATFLRLVVKLECADPEMVKLIETAKPRIIDMFQVYLREQRVEDLEGSAGLQRLREELLKRANQALAPHKVRDVLFETMLVQ
ncbi:MAG: flagellar basal body-associated FliL family protein [Alphaproteobacteria bacterium]|nr:flagellar basal body-associated FliL family protein [Alphaproteobacteria bacterium]